MQEGIKGMWHWRDKICHRKPTVREIIISYGVIGAMLGGSLFHLSQLGYAPSTLLIQEVIPDLKDHTIPKKVVNKWLYALTRLDVENPTKMILSLSPYTKRKYMNAIAEGEVRGYFTQDENTYLSEEEKENYKPKTPLNENILDALPFKDADYVYKNYMSAPGKMEFGMDMLEKWDFYELITRPIRLSEEVSGPSVLIFHTHVREDYIGGLTVTDVGEALKNELETKYGIETLHVTDSFYESSNEGKYPTGGEYERMEPVIRKVLEDHPSISVVIDLHRDGVNEKVHLVTDVDGKEAASIMFVNGLCLNRNMEGKVEEKQDLPNPYIEDNLAFSLQAMVQMNALYPGLSRKIYLNEWRYSTHMKPYSLLMEWGAQTNTSEEALNAVEPVAEILAKVLQKD